MKLTTASAIPFCQTDLDDLRIIHHDIEALHALMSDDGKALPSPALPVAPHSVCAPDRRAIGADFEATRRRSGCMMAEPTQ